MVAAATLSGNPIHILLLALGIVVTAGGCVLYTKSKQAGPEAGEENGAAVREQVRSVLYAQRENCKRLVKAWCDETLEMVGKELEGYGKE